MAPVGHYVTVHGADISPVNVNVSVTMVAGVSLATVLITKIQNAVKSYFEAQRAECVTVLGDSYPYLYELLLSISALEAAVHAQSTDIRSVSVTLEAGEVYQTDYRISYNAHEQIFLPVTGEINVTEV